MAYRKSKTVKRRFRPAECNNTMNFQECELAVLRHAVDQNEKVLGQKVASSDEIKGMIKIVEEFLMNKKLLCYGGTAINNILPKQVQFYNREYEIPDYDFFSANALHDAKELTDIFYAAGYTDVEAKSGVHEGTYKVFVNFIPMADITSIHKELFDALFADSVSVAGIKYVPPNFLRMSMYLELSRPAGDTSRWEKVLKRLNLLNKYHPIKNEYDCSAIEFQREMSENDTDGEKLYTIVRDTFVDLGVVFFGGYAASLYSKEMPKKEQQFIKKIPDFDVLTEDIERTAMIVEERLHESKFTHVKQIRHAAIGEIVPEHIEIRYKDDILAFIYKPMACHNYNTIIINSQEVNVATIDTIMSFYLAFLYAGTNYYYNDRILCTAKFLFELEQKNRLAQTGVLKRFTPQCIGVQETMESIRAKKSEKFEELRGKRGSEEYEKYFLKYSPGELDKRKNKAIDVDVKQQTDDSEGEVERLNSPGDNRMSLIDKPKKKTAKKRSKKKVSKPFGLPSLF